MLIENILPTYPFRECHAERIRGTPSDIYQAVKRFSLFSEKGYAKAAWNFAVRPLQSQTVIRSTETRIHRTDETSRRRFHNYWLAIRPFSGAIRKSILRAVKHRVALPSDR